LNTNNEARLNSLAELTLKTHLAGQRNGEGKIKRSRAESVTGWNFFGENPKRFRHYDPIAQKFFAAYGRDGVRESDND